MGGGELPPSWERTSPELDRVSVMAGGQPVAFASLPPSLSSHRKVFCQSVRAKAVGGVCGHPSRAMQAAPLVTIKTPSHTLTSLSSILTIAVSIGINYTWNGQMIIIDKFESFCKYPPYIVVTVRTYHEAMVNRPFLVFSYTSEKGLL